MNESKFTEGTWEIRRPVKTDDQDDRAIMAKNGTVMIAEVFSRIGDYEYAEVQANTAVIVEAKSMYAALGKLVNPSGPYSRDDLTYAQNVIEDMRTIASEAVERVKAHMEEEQT